MNIRWLWFLLAFWLGWFHMAHGGVKKTDFNPKFQSIRLDTTGASAPVRIRANNGDSLYIYFTDEDTCSYLYYDGSDSTWKAKPCGKEEFTLTDTSGLPFDLYLPLAGGAMSGNITASGDSLQGFRLLSGSNAANELVLYAQEGNGDGRIWIAGRNAAGVDTVRIMHQQSTEVMTWAADSISAESHKITELADPDNAQDAATKNYVDNNDATSVDSIYLKRSDSFNTDAWITPQDTLFVDTSGGGSGTTDSVYMKRSDSFNTDAWITPEDTIFVDTTASGGLMDSFYVKRSDSFNTDGWFNDLDTLFVDTSGGGSGTTDSVYVKVSDSTYPSAGWLTPDDTLWVDSTARYADSAGAVNDDMVFDSVDARVVVSDSVITPIISGGATDSLIIWFDPNSDTSTSLRADQDTLEWVYDDKTAQKIRQHFLTKRSDSFNTDGTFLLGDTLFFDTSGGGSGTTDSVYFKRTDSSGSDRWITPEDTIWYDTTLATDSSLVVQYAHVSDSVSLALRLTGGNMTGSIVMGDDSLLDVHVISGEGVANELRLFAQEGGGSGTIRIGGRNTAGAVDSVRIIHDQTTKVMSWVGDSISAESRKITMVADPDNAQDAATKNYVDNNDATSVDSVYLKRSDSFNTDAWITPEDTIFVDTTGGGSGTTDSIYLKNSDSFNTDGWLTPDDTIFVDTTASGGLMDSFYVKRSDSFNTNGWFNDLDTLFVDTSGGGGTDTVAVYLDVDGGTPTNPYLKWHTAGALTDTIEFYPDSSRVLIRSDSTLVIEADEVGDTSTYGNIDLYGQLRYWVDTGGGGHLQVFDDSVSTAPTDNQVWAWDAATTRWTIQSQTGGAGTIDSFYMKRTDSTGSNRWVTPEDTLWIDTTDNNTQSVDSIYLKQSDSFNTNGWLTPEDTIFVDTSGGGSGTVDSVFVNAPVTVARGAHDTVGLSYDSTLYNNGGELSVTALDSIGGSVADDQVENNITVWRADTADIADTAFAAERTFIYAIVNDGGADSVRVGTPVYISGYDVTDNIVEVDSAKASGASTMPAIGIAKTAGNAGDTIIVITAGELTGQNTGSFTVGEPLYIGSGGGLTETKPTGTNLIQKIGETKRVNASQGEVVVFGAGRSNDVPNIPQYNVWLGNASGVATAENLNNYLDSVTAVNYPTADSAVVAANSYTADYSDSAGIFTDRDSTSLVWGSNVVLPENGVNDDNAVSLGTEAAAFADLYLDGTLDVTGGTINFDAQSLDGADIKNNEVTSTQLADDVDFDSVDTRALFADTGDVNTGLYSLRHWTRGFALFIDTGGGTMYAPFDTVEANEPAADDVFAWDAATNSWEIKAQTGGSGTADSLSVNVSGTEYDIMSDYVKLAAGTGITFTRTDVGPGTYDSISISSTGGGDQVEIEGNAVDTVNIEGGTGITVTYTADGDGGGQDTATVAVTAQSLTKTQFDTTTTPIFAGLQLSGNLTLNMDSAAADVTIDFGQTGVDPQLLYDQSHDLFAFNEVLHQDDWSWLVNTSDTAKFDNTDNPTNGQQLTWATGGIIRWEDAGSGTGYWTLTEASGDTSIRWIEGTDSVLQIELDPSNDSVFVRTDDGSSAHVLVVEADKIGSGTGIITVESDSTTIDSVVYFTGRTQMDSLNLGGTGWMVDPAGQNLTITSGVLDAADTVRQADTATYLTTSAATGEWVAYNASLNQFLPHTDAATSLGATSIRFTDAYLSGTLQAEAIQTNNEVNNELQIIPDTVRPNDDRVAIWGTPAFEIKRVNAASIVADTLLSVDSADITNFTDGNIDLNDLAANSVDSTKVVANSISIPSDLAQATKAELEGRISDVSDFAEADGDVYSNTHDFTTAVLEIPNSLNPNPTAVGRIAQDQNDYAIVGTDGTNDFWLGVQDKVFIWTIDSAAALVNDSVIILPIETTFWPGGITLTSLGFKSRDDATDSLWFEWWTEPEADVGTESVIDTLTQAGATEVTSTSFTDATGAAGEMLVVIIKLASGQPLTVFGSFRVNTNN